MPAVGDRDTRAPSSLPLDEYLMAVARSLHWIGYVAGVEAALDLGGPQPLLDYADKLARAGELLPLRQLRWALESISAKRQH